MKNTNNLFFKKYWVSIYLLKQLIKKGLIFMELNSNPILYYRRIHLVYDHEIICYWLNEWKTREIIEYKEVKRWQEWMNTKREDSY